jgi:hypothetical protein
VCRRGLKLSVVELGALVTLGAGVGSAPAMGRAVPERASLLHYLSGMSWPVRASTLRSNSVGVAISGWLDPSDPPYLGQIAASCKKLRAVEARGHLLQVTPPQHLEGNHGDLSRAYSQVRAGCQAARLTALGVRAAIDRSFRTRSAVDKAASQRAEATARQSLARFASTTLRSFTQAVARWRLAVLRYAADLGVRPPEWVKDLPVRSSR